MSVAISNECFWSWLNFLFGDIWKQWPVPEKISTSPLERIFFKALHSTPPPPSSTSFILLIKCLGFWGSPHPTWISNPLVEIGRLGEWGRGVKVFSGATVYTILKQLELVISEMSRKYMYFFTDNWILFAKLIYFLGLLKSKVKLTNNQTCKEDLATQLYMSRAFSAQRGLPWWFSQGHPTISKILKVLPFVVF